MRDGNGRGTEPQTADPAAFGTHSEVDVHVNSVSQLFLAVRHIEAPAEQHGDIRCAVIEIAHYNLNRHI